MKKEREPDSKFSAAKGSTYHIDDDQARSSARSKMVEVTVDIEVKSTLKCFLDPGPGSPRTTMEEELDLKDLECVCVFIGSGASDSIFPIDERKDSRTFETATAKHGDAYKAVGGHRAMNEGQRNVTFFSQDCDLGSIGSQAAAVNKARGSVAELVDSGHKVLFDGEVPDIENKRGKQTRFRMINGMWYLDCWRVPHKIANSQEEMSKFFKGGARGEIHRSL